MSSYDVDFDSDISESEIQEERNKCNTCWDSIDKTRSDFLDEQGLKILLQKLGCFNPIGKVIEACGGSTSEIKKEAFTKWYLQMMFSEEEEEEEIVNKNAPKVFISNPSDGGWSASLKKQDDEWECATCMLRQKKCDVKCLACGARNPAAPKEVIKFEGIGTGSALPSNFSFGGPPAPPSTFSFGGPPVAPVPLALKNEMEELKQKNKELSEQNAALKAKIVQLEEEADLMAFENYQLRGEKDRKEASATSNSTPNEDSVEGTVKPSLLSGGGYAQHDEVKSIFTSPHATSMADDEPILDVGDGNIADKCTLTIEKCNNGLNLLCGGCTDVVDGNLLVVTAGVDKSLTFFKIETNRDERKSVVLGKLRELGGPVLCLQFHPIKMQLIAGGMDGSHYLIDYENSSDPSILIQKKEHKLYVVASKFSPCGNFYATGSHDKSVNLYKLNKDENESECLTNLFFKGKVEAIEFYQGEESLYLIISVRESSTLIYVNCKTLEKEYVSLNDKSWDDFPSFTVLSLAVSPNNKYLLAATDKHRHIIYKIGSNLQVQNLYGHFADEYANPRITWDPTGKYVYSNSKHQVCIWCVASGRLLKTLDGHQKLVRDIYCHKTRNLILTVSYDQNAKIWEN